MTGSDELTDYERKILADVEEFGCHVTTVFDPAGAGPSYSYSTGFTESLKQPEVIVFGLDHDVMHRMVNLARDRCREGLVLTDGMRIPGLLEGFEVMARAIPADGIDRDHFNSAMWFHRRRFDSELTEAFQLVWPSAVDGLFPWDADCSDFVIDSQPPLYAKGTVH